MSLVYFLFAYVLLPMAAGIAFIPFWVFLKLPLPRQLSGRIFFILGQVCQDGSALYDVDGDIKLLPFDAGEGRMFLDGDWIDIDDETTYRVGWRPLAIVPEVSEDTLRDYLVDTGETARADGGVVKLNQTSGGYQLASDCFGAGHGITIDACKYIRDIGRSGNRLINQAEEYALRKYGGDSHLSDIWLLLILAGAFVTMFVVTWGMLSI